MRNRLRALILVSCLILASLPASLLVSFPAGAQEEPNPLLTWLTLVNEARLDEDLAPYGFSTHLSGAAQRHADDLTANQLSSHTGSDESSPSQRIAETGYAAWTGDDGEPIVAESFWTGQGTAEDALAALLAEPADHDNILSPIYRQIGIGVATDADGRSCYVLSFGARPNVLPIFINYGATNADSPQVAIRLTNEEARPGGHGMTFMGQAIEIRISDEPDFGDLGWQRWERLVPWTLPDVPGEHVVYVQFRDAGGRVTTQSDSIVLGEGTPSTPLFTQPSPAPESAAPPAEPDAAPDVAGTPESSTAELLATPSAPGLTPFAPNLTPFPTWTPLPTPTPEEAEEPEESEPDAPLALLAALQGVVIILGVYLILRRGKSK